MVADDYLGPYESRKIFEEQSTRNIVQRKNIGKNKRRRNGNLISIFLAARIWENKNIRFVIFHPNMPFLHIEVK